MKTLRRGKSAAFIYCSVLSAFTCVIMVAFVPMKEFGFIIFALFTITGTVYYVSSGELLVKISFVTLNVLISASMGISAFFISNAFEFNGFLTTLLISVSVVSATMLMLYLNPDLTTGKEKQTRCGDANNERITYSQYKSLCRITWFQSLPSFIYNISKPHKIIRVTTLAASMFISTYATADLIKAGINSSNAYDILIYLAIFCYGLVFFWLGLVYATFISGIFSAISYSAVSLGAALTKHSEPVLAVVFPVAVLFVHIAITSIIWRAGKWEMLYSNVQVFERDNDSIAIDLFLSECRPVRDMDRLVSFEIAFEDIKELLKALKTILSASHRASGILAGYFAYANANIIKFYIYTSDSDKFINRMQKDISAIGLCANGFECEHDEEWKVFSSLYPTEEEMDSIINISLIHQLYSKGLESDKQYDISFYVRFKSKNDPVAFEESICYYGFTLSFASFVDENKADYAYYGQYMIKTYVTPRRINYLCSQIKRQANDFGAQYLGEWLIDV